MAAHPRQQLPDIRLPVTYQHHGFTCCRCGGEERAPLKEKRNEDDPPNMPTPVRKVMLNGTIVTLY
jgi:hypothetical protein